MPVSSPTLVLASQSPRRRELLAQLGVLARILPSDVDETPAGAESASDYVRRIALAKVNATAAPHDSCVLGADTSVVLDGCILGKPANAQMVRHTLGSLSGRTHSVFTAVALRSAKDLKVVCVETRVTFRELSDVEIGCYIASNEPWDKAGAYGIQGLGGAFVSRIDGSYSNVVGLPLCETLVLLRGAGIPSSLDVLPGDA